MAKTKSTEEEVPLHEVVLKVMFEVNKEKPQEMTASDVFWKMSDPALSERQVTEVLNWLVHKRRLEHFAGKYSLDRFEFLDQKKAEQEEEAPKKPARKPRSTTTPKAPKAVKPKEPSKPKEPVKPKEPPVVSKVNTVEKKRQEEKSVVKEVPRPEVPEPVPVKPSGNKKWLAAALLAIAALFFVYTTVVLFTTASPLDQLMSADKDLLELELLSSQIADSEVAKIELMEKRLDVYQNILQRNINESKLKDVVYENFQLSVNRMMFFNGILLLILAIFIYRKD